MQKELKLKIFSANAAVKGIQHYKLADMCGLSRSAFSLMINGHRDISPEIEKKPINTLNLERTIEALSDWKEEESVWEMNEFAKLLRVKGMGNTEHLIDFIELLVDDPGMFYSLSIEERVEMEKKLDKALKIFEETMDPF